MMSQFEFILEKYTEKTKEYNQKKRDCLNYAFLLIAKVVNALNWPQDQTLYIFLKDISKGFTDENITKIDYRKGVGIDQIDINKIVTFSKDNLLQVDLCLKLFKQTKNHTIFDNSININFILSVLIKENGNKIHVQTSLNEDVFTFNTKMDCHQSILRMSQAIINKIDEFPFIKQNQGETEVPCIEI